MIDSSDQLPARPLVVNISTTAALFVGLVIAFALIAIGFVLGLGIDQLPLDPPR